MLRYEVIIVRNEWKSFFHSRIIGILIQVNDIGTNVAQSIVCLRTKRNLRNQHLAGIENSRNKFRHAVESSLRLWVSASSMGSLPGILNDFWRNIIYEKMCPLSSGGTGDCRSKYALSNILPYKARAHLGRWKITMSPTINAQNATHIMWKTSFDFSNDKKWHTTPPPHWAHYSSDDMSDDRTECRFRFSYFTMCYFG